ncbi:MAG: hypothetical protein WAV45_01470 [Propionibacteriaceae bacterium]
MNTTLTPWETEFTLRLRAANVSGTNIGDALEQVRAHCAESGETPLEAFGDPGDYADSLPFQRPTQTYPRARMVSDACGFFGMLLTTAAAFPIRLGQPFEVRLTPLIGAVLVGAAIAALTVVGPRLWAAVVARPWLLAIPFVVVVGTSVGFAALPGPVLGTVSPWLVLGVGVTLLLVGLWLALRTPLDVDPLMSPVSDNSAELRLARSLTSKQPWIYLVFSALTVAALLLIPR